MKPHIIRFGGVFWHCRMPGFRVSGFGPTAFSAYCMWRKGMAGQH